MLHQCSWNYYHAPWLQYALEHACTCIFIDFFVIFFFLLGMSVKNIFLFTMTAYSGQALTRTTLGQLCDVLWDSQSLPVVIQPRIEQGSVVTPLALRCSALVRCATRFCVCLLECVCVLRVCVCVQMSLLCSECRTTSQQQTQQEKSQNPAILKDCGMKWFA